MRRTYKLTSLDGDRLKTKDGYSLRISRCGINHHPAGPHCDAGRFYPFAPVSRQDRSKEGLIRMDVVSGLGGSVTHYLSVNSLEEIVGPRFLRRKNQ